MSFKREIRIDTLIKNTWTVDGGDVKVEGETKYVNPHSLEMRYGKRADEAELILKEALSIDPTIEQIWIRLCDLYFMKNDFDRTIETCIDALLHFPRNRVLRFFLGHALLLKKERWKAIDAWSPLHGNIHWDSYIDPELVTCKTQLAEAHVRIGEYDKAEEICKEAIKIESGRADTWYSLGYIYYKQQKYDEAIEANKESLEFGSEENYVNSYYIGKAYLYKGEFENAIESFKEALEFNPEYADAWNDLGSAYSEVGNYEDSEKAHKRALEVSPMDANIWTRLVLLYVNDQKKPDKAMDICNKILEVNPEDAKGWAYKGATHFNKKEIDEAFAAINRSLEIDPKLEGAWGQLGRIYARKGENDKALEAYEKALEIDPKFKEVIKLREKLLESMKAAEKKTPRSWE